MPSSPPARSHSTVGRLLRIITAAVGTVLLSVLALVVLGAFTPNIPVLGVFGAAAAGVAPWFGVIFFIVGVISVWLLIRKFSLWRSVVAGIAALSLVGTVVITTQLVSLGARWGVSVNPFATVVIGNQPDKSVEYATAGGEPLHVDLWTPRSRSGDAPVAFFTHGGGWVSGDASADVAGLFTQLSDAGWLVVSAEYTLASPSHHTSSIVESQVGCALAWTEANAAKYGANTARFVSLGESAGGNLAINTAYRTDAGDLSCSESSKMPTIDAVVTLFPGVSATALYNDPIAGGSIPGRTFVEQYIGGSPKEFPEEYKAVDSATHIDEASPPTLIFQGNHDHLVQPPSVYQFVDRARTAGVDVSLVRVPFGEHGFPLVPFGGDLYTKITLKWLTEQGLMP